MRNEHDNPYFQTAINIYRFFNGPVSIEDMSVNDMKIVLNRARLLELNDKKVVDSYYDTW